MKKNLILSDEGLKDFSAWESAGYVLPKYDRAQMIAATKKNPAWIHFGAGNIFKAFQANAAQKLLNEGLISTGITAVERKDSEHARKDIALHNNLTILVTLKSDGTIEKNVIGSIAETLFINSSDPSEFLRLKEIFSAPSLQIASFTITEKGYTFDVNETEKSPDEVSNYMGKIARLLYERFQAGKFPVAMVSMDNCSHNGDILFQAVSSFAEGWVKNNFAPKEFLDYIRDPEKVSFNWTMIDKITPRPDSSIAKILADDGVAGMDLSVNEGGTYLAPFVNAEESEYLVVEDKFPNGRPPLERAGILFTDRKTVDLSEKMKVGTCLNPLHTALAIFGCLLGYEKISDEMKDPDLLNLIKGIGYGEGLKVVADPSIISPKEFIDTVINVRLPNPFLPDTPYRIATDTSQKLPIRFGETIKAYIESDALEVSSLKLIPLVFAGWLRYLTAVDDTGKTFTPSPDPMLEYAQNFVKDFKLGQAPKLEDTEKKLAGLLSNKKIFGVDLVEVGMSPLVCKYFNEMISAPGAVRKIIKG